MTVLSVVVEYYGIRVMKVFPVGSNVERAFLIGSSLYGDVFSEAIEIMVHKKSGNYAIENVAYNLSKANLEPSTIAVLALSKDRDNFVLASRLPVSEASEEARLTYSSVQGVELSFPFAYSVERSVIICGSAYIVRLHVWKMSF